MRNELRVVLDTNVLVSAFLFPGSVPGRVLFQPKDPFVPLMSTDLFRELVDVLNRPKLDPYVTQDRRKELLIGFLSQVELIEVSVTIEACRDPRDNHVLELAVSGSANAIVTGDLDLLALNPFQGISIVNPAEFALLP